MRIQLHANGVRIWQGETLVVKVTIMGNVQLINDDGELRAYCGNIGKPFDQITIGEAQEWVMKRNRLVNGYCRYWG